MARVITPEQAAMLIPLLAQIASTPKGGHSSSNSSSPGSFQSTPGQTQILSTPLASSDGKSSSGYSVTELLTKKKRNTSSSEPQKYLQVLSSAIYMCDLSQLLVLATYISCL